MTIPDEAVQAAARKDAEMSGRTFDALSSSEKKRYLVRSHEQLTAALPFLVRVKALDDDTMQKLREALRFSASRSVMSNTDEARILSAIEPAPSPRAQPLEEERALSDRLASALEYIDDYSLSYPDLGTISAVAQPALEMYEAVRALSSQPVANALPQDVINLVLAAREAWETWQLPEEEFKRLDTALEPFASRVLYENEPDALPASPGASE